MSQFSERLKFLIDDCGIPIYQLAKNADLDRTTIQRSITGERLPKLSFVEKLCDYLRITTKERKHLLELYSISKIGEKRYQSRNYIKKIIEQIADLHIHENTETYVHRYIHEKEDSPQDLKILNGQLNVNKAISDIIDMEIAGSEATRICLTIPFDYTYLFDYMKQRYWESNGSLYIEHIVRIYKNPQNLNNSNINLEILSHILPFAFCTGKGYGAYYFYTNDDIASELALTMPYYLLTSNRLITISTDFKSAVLYKNEEMIRFYHEEFDKALAQTAPLVSQIQECTDMISTYLSVFEIAGQPLHVMEPQPCLGKYYTHKHVEDHLRKEVPNREQAKKSINQFYDNYKAYTLPSYYFTLEGLQYMVNTGIIAGLPTHFATPFSSKETKVLLSSLRKEIAEDIVVSRIINPGKLRISPITSLQIFEKDGLLLVTANDKNIISCFIKEQSINEAFLDFFESLSTSDLLYSKEETLDVLDEMIHITLNS